MVLAAKNLPASGEDARNMGSITGSGRSPGEGHGYPLPYSCMENSMNRGAWWATVHGVPRVRHDLANRPPPHEMIKATVVNGSEILGIPHVAFAQGPPRIIS